MERSQSDETRELEQAVLPPDKNGLEPADMPTQLLQDMEVADQEQPKLLTFSEQCIPALPP